MPPPRNVGEVVAALESAQDDELVGLAESRWFDAKGKPYRLDDRREKWELVKDVSALANAEGGVILVAARTEKPETYLEERVTEVVPVPAAMVDVKQYFDTIAAWTFPPLTHRVRPHTYDRDGGRVLLLLEVDPLERDEQPALVATLAPIGGRDVPTWAIARRVGSGTEWVSAAQVWADIRDGRLARRARTVEEHHRPGPSAEERVLAALALLIDAMAAEGRAVLAYAAVPPPGHRLEPFYAEDGIRGVLRTMPERAIRRAGFWLGYGQGVRATDGALADIEEGRRGVLVQADGTLAAVAVATPDFLGWADRGVPPNSLVDKANVRLNPYVLAEYSLEFARFLDDVLMDRLVASGWTLAATAKRLQTGDPIPYLPTGTDHFTLGGRAAVVDDDMATFPATGDPERDAFELLRQFIEWFGASADEVPFATDGRITAETIRSWRPEQ